VILDWLFGKKCRICEKRTRKKHEFQIKSDEGIEVLEICQECSDIYNEMLEHGKG
jgi:hypothetical protein